MAGVIGFIETISGRKKIAVQVLRQSFININYSRIFFALLVASRQKESSLKLFTLGTNVINKPHPG